mmetsp:Transcript_30019/g.57944  ORF Transcript_30019/g.57944 Transcript_30019/m.57944 type:complete len:88 (+) Transcript_30019:393-656(+)|eukprot:4145323-Pleurochrysis_carterae.AAC.1
MVAARVTGARVFPASFALLLFVPRSDSFEKEVLLRDNSSGSRDAAAPDEEAELAEAAALGDGAPLEDAATPDPVVWTFGRLLSFRAT